MIERYGPDAGDERREPKTPEANESIADHWRVNTGRVNALPLH